MSKLKLYLKRYQKVFGYDDKFEWNRKAFKMLVGCDRILDVGCGAGWFMEYIKDFVSYIEGIDGNDESIKLCNSKGLNAKIGNVTNMKMYKDESFDGIHCSHVIEHLNTKDAHKMLVEIDRILKIGGVLCIKTPIFYQGFYNDFTHIKPYHPEAILHYLRIDNDEYKGQRSLPPIRSIYELIRIDYRSQQLFPWLSRTPFWLLSVITNIMKRFGIGSIQKNGYMIALKKLE